MDASDAREGTTVFLPVFHEGAYFYFGLFDDDSPLAVRTAASLHLPEVRACHEEMARLKQSFKKAA